MGIWGRITGREKKELAEVDMEREPPRVPGAPPMEQPVDMSSGRPAPSDDEYEEGEDEEDDYEIEEIDMADAARQTMQRPVMPSSHASEVGVGKQAYRWDIRKRVHRDNPAAETIDVFEDAEAPDQRYIETELKSIYGGGWYMIYHGSRIVTKFRIPGEPRWQEDIDAEKKRRDEGLGEGVPTSMQGLLYQMMKTNEASLTAMREENVKLQNEVRKAQLDAVTGRLEALEKGGGVGDVIKTIKEYKELMEIIPPHADPLDKILDNPVVQKSISTFIDKVSEVDFSKTDLFNPAVMQGMPPGVQPGMAPQGPPPIVRRDDYVSSIQGLCLQRGVTIPSTIIARCVDKALQNEQPDPRDNLTRSVDYLDAVLDARRALAHLKKTVIEGDTKDTEAAKFILEKFPTYGEYLKTNDYDAMIKFLDDFSDIKDMQPMITFARRDDVKAHVQNIVKIVREEAMKAAKPDAAKVPDVQGQ